MLSNHALAQRLPDIPRWIEVRDLLLSDDCEVSGLQETPDLSFSLRETGTHSIFIIGTPTASAIQAAIQSIGSGAEIIAPPENANWLAQLLPGWKRTRIILHTLSDHRSLPNASEGEVVFLDPATIEQLPIFEELLNELKSGAEHSLIAARIIANQPVSFCYVSSETEILWDVAIDTLPEHQRKGYAAQCAAFMIRHMQTQGKQPVWQSLEENPASWKLAQKIGFKAIDELALFEMHA
jgi:RimJ/RimL family protein N-acetyltransferase